MWVLLRLALSALGLGVRLRATTKARPHAAGTYESVPYFVKSKNDSDGNTISILIGMPLESSVVLRLTREGKLDRLCKWLGLAEEMQTGDKTFDDRVYVACDHAALTVHLAREPQVRDAILAAFDRGFSRIWSDGRTLWAFTKAVSRPREDELLTLHRLRACLARLVFSQSCSAFFWVVSLRFAII